MSRDFEGPSRTAETSRPAAEVPTGRRVWAAVLAAVLSGAVLLALVLTAVPATNG